MDADSSYGGSDTAQDSHSGHDHSSSLETTHNDVTTAVHDVGTQPEEPNNFYHKNEITLPVNYDETDFQDDHKIDKQPHYLSTANLNINETLEHHSNLEEMSKNYKSTNYLNESPKMRKKSDAGVVNPAFQEDDYAHKTEVKSTFDNTKPYNGDLNSSSSLGLTSPNKNDEPLTEAVNLELINLKPAGKDVAGPYENGNGTTNIPVKKENDAEMGNPYDEYFVPVNEHRKYMRGEKLYVTMDKRNKKKRNKCLCWGICLCLVAAAVIIGILAAVGIIGNQGGPVQEVSARNFGASTNEPEVKAAGGIFGLPKDLTHVTTTPAETETRRLTPGPPVVTVSSFLPTTETSMIQVPRALESQLVIDNLQFTPALSDHNSTEYKKLAEALETELKNSLFSSETLNYGAANIDVKIMDFSSGSVVVKYRITWTFKDGVHAPKDPINEEALKRKMRSLLDRNSGFMDTYHIVGNTVTAERILDLCKIDNNGCEHICTFDYRISDFTCLCPEGKYLAHDQKTCTDQPILEPETVTDFHFDHVHIPQQYETSPHPKSEPSAEPEPSTDLDYDYIHDPHHLDIDTTPEPQSTRPHSTETVFEPSPKPTPEPESKPKELDDHYNHHIIVEPSAEPNTTPEPEPTNKPEEVSHESYVHVQVDPVAEPTTTEPSAEPSPEPNAASKIEPTPEPTAEPSANETTMEHDINHGNNIEHEHVLIATTEPTAAPTAKPAAEPTAEPVAEPTAEPAAEPTVKSVEPLAEPTAEPTAEPAAEPTVKSVEPLAEPTAEPTAEPAAEPTAEPIAEPAAEPTAEPIAEPAAEPTAEPTAELSRQSTQELSAENKTTENTTKSEMEPNKNFVLTTMSTVEHSSESSLTTTPLSEGESRHGHFSGDIFAETDTTTISDDKQSTSQTTTIRADVEMNGPVSAAKSVENITTLKPEITSRQDETTSVRQNETVVVNNHLLELEKATETSKVEYVTIPIIINDEHKVVHSINVEIKNETETTTQTSDMTKIFTEMHKVIDSRVDQSTEAVINESTNQTSNQTHFNVTVMESTENTSASDNMSPFLPELDNDTFVNKLHLGEHLPHNQNETHEEDMAVPPRLDNDQMNMTNPRDTNPQDTSLKVIPLEGAENEVLEKILSSTEISKIKEDSIALTTILPEKLNDSENGTVVNETLKDQEITESHVINTTPITTTSTTTEIRHEISNEVTTVKASEEVKTTLPPEIINNVHSNAYFDNLDRLHKPEEESNKTKETNFSTEDLLALETTTNTVKTSENKTAVADTTTEAISKVSEPYSTVHAEIIDTATDSVNFAPKVQEYEVTTIKSEEAVNITTAIPSSTTEASQHDNNLHQYEVKETIADFTTTEKLFVATRATTELPLIPKTNYEDLSVIPLNADEVSSKNNDKRVTNEEKFNQLESDNNEASNDISEEEQLVMDKFHHNFNEISDATTSKIDEVETKTEYEYDLAKYNESKSEKKSFQDKDKYKYDKKAKFEKVITTVNDEEMMTTSLPNDKNASPFSDIKPVTEDFILPTFSRCAVGQFQCANGTSTKDGSYCIPGNDRCDNVEDCNDASDEIDCEREGCPNNFQCASGQCLKRHLVCDGIQNCNDGTDEIACDQWTCRFDEFPCGPGRRCLPLSWKCDGRKQCPDGSDEHNCPSSLCTAESFRCAEQDTCIPNSWKCDGKSDCMNSEDERSCQCGSDEFKCVLGGGCIKNDLRCDGVDQCSDRSDEWNCFNNTKYLQVEVSNNTWYPVCSENWNQTYSDMVCQYLGYSGSSLSETTTKPEGEYKGYLKLKSHTTYGSHILSQMEKTDPCDSFVTITCQEFACGSHSAIDLQTARIIGGNRGVDTQWPSLTLLYNKKRNSQCTATLVAPAWVIASYSCVEPQSQTVPNDWMLYAGSTNFFSNADNSTIQVRQIKKIIPHPQAKFSQFEFTNDVILIELTNPLTLTRNVSAVCLPDKDIEPRQLCVIAGWGVSKPGEPNKNQYLHYLPVPVIDSNECNSTKHYNGLMNDGTICAGYTDPEKTPCYNDEGAPLMCFSDSAGTWELQGVLSHHDNCARNKHPAIYTSVNSKIRNWVSNTIGQKPSRSV